MFRPFELKAFVHIEDESGDFDKLHILLTSSFKDRINLHHSKEHKAIITYNLSVNGKTRIIGLISPLPFFFKFFNIFWALTYNLRTPFKYDIRGASLCGVEFVVTKERRENRAQRESYLKDVRTLQLQYL